MSMFKTSLILAALVAAVAVAAFTLGNARSAQASPAAPNETIAGLSWKLSRLQSRVDSLEYQAQRMKTQMKSICTYGTLVYGVSVGYGGNLSVRTVNCPFIW